MGCDIWGNKQIGVLKMPGMKQGCPYQGYVVRAQLVFWEYFIVNTEHFSGYNLDKLCAAKVQAVCTGLLQNSRECLAGSNQVATKEEGCQRTWPDEVKTPIGQAHASAKTVFCVN